MRLFTKTELKHLKWKLMKRGLTEEQASMEIKGMIETSEKNHEKALEEEAKKVKDKFQEKIGRKK